MRRYWILVVLCLVTSLMSTASADRSDAMEYEAILEETSFESVDLWTEVGTPVEVWVEGIGNDTSSHPIDVYITTWDAYLMNHVCEEINWNEDNSFQPLYHKEELSPNELPFHFSWTPEIEDDYVLFFDNCDNNRDSDYYVDQSQIIIKYAVDDQTDEVAEGFLAVLGGSMLLCCGGPVCLLIVIIVAVVMLTRKKPPQNAMGYQAPGMMPVQQGMPAPQQAYQAPAPAPTPAPAPAPTQQYAPPAGGVIPPLGGQPPQGGQGGF
ncbi:MAG: hypothetical protein CMA77_00425 [Euryarchaeota archaeon]|nr:hypothetical protein [Euryarchaeota archaeon]